MYNRGRGRQLEGAKMSRTTAGEKSRGLAQSLIISPDLEALLEYEERMRGITNQLSVDSSAGGSSSQIPSSPGGLPPPPRKRTKPQSPTSLQTDASTRIFSEFSGITASLPSTPTLLGPLESNPYINSPPALKDILQLGYGVGETGMEAINTDPRDKSNSADGRKRRRAHQRSRSSGDERALNEPQPSLNSSAHSSPTSSSKPRTDKFFNIKNTFGIFSDIPSPEIELNDVSNAPLTQRSRVKLGDRSLRIKGKLSRLASGDTDRPRNMEQVNEETVLDIRRQEEDMTDGIDGWPSPDDVDHGFRRRALLSHDGSSSRSSWDSLSSNGPTSTIEPRISISSTIYPVHSSHSHSRSMYQSADGHPIPSLAPKTSSVDSDHTSFIEFSSPMHPDNLRSHSQPSTRPASPKPPVPTVPKPSFNRSIIKTSPRLRMCDPDQSVPPTTNLLDLDERLELIKRNQKLARVFGRSPGPDVTPTLPALTRHLRGSLSMSNHLDQNLTSTWPAATGGGRRHSIPMIPDDFSVTHTPEGGSVISAARNPTSNDQHTRAPTSFIDLSDDLGSASFGITTKTVTSLPSSPSSQSLFENMSLEERVEEERRRKRAKLVKLHRFLGSQVPPGLILGFDDPELSLPPDKPVNAQIEDEDVSRKPWVRRRRSSSAAVFPSTWSDDLDRLKEDLNDKEKAINVRRALKMEKVFGVAPPQILFHTRCSPSPSVGGVITNHKGQARTSTPGETYTTTFQRNPNRTSYMKPKYRTNDRPGTSESNKQLLPKGRSFDPDGSPTDQRKQSNVYSHFQDSLNSLNDIIDRDDKEGLAQLHEYLNYSDMAISPRLQDFSRESERRLSSASSIKSERRHSLPTNTSSLSLVDEYCTTTPRPVVMDFQARRRRATKLTQFFGVDYRELISDVLESIESGLEFERRHGTLNPDEAEELLARLRNLKTRREGLF